jgi:bifunctional DNA-binding transcriptional regulator/antitoxin component of YhaV-PrlF toxin-antitoxin module
MEKTRVHRVGKRGELYPPKEIREKLGMSPGRKVLYKVELGCLVVEPIRTVAELLKEKPAVTISLEEFHRDRREMSRATEK